jgi:hypothetical protein
MQAGVEHREVAEPRRRRGDDALVGVDDRRRHRLPRIDVARLHEAARDELAIALHQLAGGAQRDRRRLLQRHPARLDAVHGEDAEDRIDDDLGAQRHQRRRRERARRHLDADTRVRAHREGHRAAGRPDRGARDRWRGLRSRRIAATAATRRGDAGSGGSQRTKQGADRVGHGGANGGQRGLCSLPHVRPAMHALHRRQRTLCPMAPRLHFSPEASSTKSATFDEAMVAPSKVTPCAWIITPGGSAVSGSDSS